MTDRIDLDDLEPDDESDDDSNTRGDWLWRDDGSVSPDLDSSPSTRTETERRSRERDGNDSETDESDNSRHQNPRTPADRTPVPHVPKTEDPTPAGIPTQGTDAEDGASSTASRSTAAARSGETESMRPMGGGTDEADGPHGSGVDEMTMAITYPALKRLASPAAVFASAYEWSDWIGIVGDVPAHVVQKFQRDHGIDVDFFNGTGTGPAERLAEIDRNSMFYADRMVLVGLEGEDESIAETADWEFVPLETAAEKADWELEDQS